MHQEHRLKDEGYDNLAMSETNNVKKGDRMLIVTDDEYIG